MQKILYCCLFSLAIFWTACKEEPIAIPVLSGNVPNGGTTVAKKILVEEYTGTGCVNCPDGAAILGDLATIYKENIILVSIHAGYFTKKSQVPKEAKLDLTTPKGTELQLFLGEPEGYPAAIINRKVRDANGSLVAGSKDQWASLIKDESKESSNAKIAIKKTFDAATRQLSVDLTFTAIENLKDSYAYTVMLTETNIVDAQKTSAGVKTDYVHKHVLRDILTAASGDAISESLTKNTSINRSLKYTVPTTFNEKNGEIIVILHKKGSSKEVIQAESAKI
jgi:hypothetical protein